MEVVVVVAAMKAWVVEMTAAAGVVRERVEAARARVDTGEHLPEGAEAEAE